MSKYFVRSASENIKEIFNKKQLYKIVSRSDHKNLVDFTYGEKILYGRVDRYFQPIIPNETFFKLQGIGGNSAPDIKVFDFVAEAFHELQAKFNVTKTPNTSLSDTEIKQRVINLIDTYFNIDNWDFGEDFYFTEMAAFIHNNMIGEISQITISSVADDSDGTRLFEIGCNSDELFLPVVKTSNVVVQNTSSANLTTISENTSGISSGGY